MTEKKRPSRTGRLKNFLVTGSIEGGEEEWDIPEEEEDERMEVEIEIAAGRPDEEAPDDVLIEDIVAEAADAQAYADPPQHAGAYEAPPYMADTGRLEAEVAELRAMVAGLAAGMDRYATTKEQLREYSAAVNKRDAELANRKFVGMLEQLSLMREDFFKLCAGMRDKLDSFSPKDILGSFEAYGVDMENILVDCGVEIGPSRFDRLNTIHQRIVGVVPAGDESMNGTIAERVSDGYVYQGRVLLKEKVKIYRYSENRMTEGDEEK
ncbi:MAG: nucleotide exchange factor GrpE [Methanomassiliicoccaceae archaeon]|nr:nucleotide exchange factor GrpE [Methanomassiliicoccaceae archaeon]